MRELFVLGFSAILFISGVKNFLLDELSRNLFQEYEPAVRPRCGVHGGTYVNVDMALRQIIELDEPHQLLKSIVWVRLKWEDCRLKWNSSNYDGVDHLVVSQKRIWVPDITLYDNADNNLRGITEYSLAIANTGVVKYNFPSVILSLCPVEVTHFPFDYQMCKLTFGSWTYSSDKLDVRNTSRAADLTSYIHNVEWDVQNVPVRREVTEYASGNYSTVTFVIMLERRPLFYSLNLIFPCFLITSVAILGFLLPPAAGEKVNLEITVMLSLAVFQLIVLELMPPTGETVPFIGMYFIVSMLLVGMSCLFTVFVLNVHFKSESQEEMPAWVKKCIYQPLAKIMCVREPDIMVNDPPTVLPRRFSTMTSLGRHNLSRRQSCAVYPSSERGSNAVCHANTNGRRNTIDAQISISSDSRFNPKPSSNSSRTFKLNDIQVLSTLESLSNGLQTVREELDGRAELYTIGVEWKLLAIILDRLFLLIYVLSLAIGIITLSVKYIHNRDMPDTWSDS